jgi:Glycosyl hydrolase catalytic core
MRLQVLLSLVLLATSAHAADTAEAAKVASWVRALPPVDPNVAIVGVLGGASMTALGPGSQVIRTSGPAAFYSDSPVLAQSIELVRQRGVNYLAPLAAGSILWFRDVQNVPWGLLEVSPGTYRWEVLDAVVKSVQTAGGRYVGTVMPYAGWELRASGYAPTTDEQCLRLLTEDFYYLAADQRMDRYKDEAAYQQFLAAAVERYDGDGVSDMPGLTTPIIYWQIHNEPEGNHCGLFRGNETQFARHMQISRETIAAACPACKVLNGGAATPLFKENQVPPLQGVNFWRDYALAGGAPYIDIIAVHYNQGKDPDHGNVADFEYQVRRARELLGAAKPVWVTEFGVVIGDHGNFKGLTEKEAAAWYVRMYSAGLATGATRFFSDASSFLEMNGTTYLTFYVNKLVQTKLGGFTSAAKLVTGQYRFRVNGADVYVLWSGVPSSLTGTVTATDFYGNIVTTNAALLTPSELSPLFVEPRSSKRRAVR